MSFQLMPVAVAARTGDAALCLRQRQAEAPRNVLRPSSDASCSEKTVSCSSPKGALAGRSTQPSGALERVPRS